MATKIEKKARRPNPPKGGRRNRANGKPDEPLYVQVARTLKEEIVSGVYPVGSQLPTEDRLCERFSVSRHTVREALRRLRDDHLVSSRRGACTTVVPAHTSDSYVHDVMSMHDVLAFATGTRFAIESIKMVVLDEKLASRTGLARGEEWLAVCGYGHREGDDLPVCWAEYYINRKFAAVGRLLQRHTGLIFPLIEDMFGQRIAEVRQDIAPTQISPALAAGLKVRAGTAALDVRYAFILSTGDVAQVTISTNPASRYRHSMTVKRVKR